MKSIKNLVSDAIEEFRQRTKVLATLDNPNASLAEKAMALKAVLDEDSNFWQALVKRMACKKTISVQVPTPTKSVVVTVTPAPVTSVAHATPALPATAPARMLKPQSNGNNGKVISGDFASKLAGAAEVLDLETPLTKFRAVLGQNGRGKDYWDECRALLIEVLKGGLLKEETDWRLLAEKMKRNLFFSGRAAEVFLERCPKDVLEDLLVGQSGLFNLVEQIRHEEEFDNTSPYRIWFIIDACVVVGREAKDLLTNCKHAANRMKMKRFISPDHPLILKIAAMKVASRQATSKTAPPELVAIRQEAENAAQSEPEPEISQTDPSNISDEDLERLTAPESGESDVTVEVEAEFATAN